MATQTNSQTRLKNIAPRAMQGIAGEVPAPKLDTTALSAGVRAVMGKDAASGAPEGATAAAEAKDQEETGSALVSASVALEAEEGTGLIERLSVEARLPVQLEVGIPIRDFRVKNLLVLEPGSLIESSWMPGEDVPVASGEVQLAWSEFEVVDSQLAVRLTRLT